MHPPTMGYAADGGESPHRTSSYAHIIPHVAHCVKYPVSHTDFAHFGGLVYHITLIKPSGNKCFHSTTKNSAFG